VDKTTPEEGTRALGRNADEPGRGKGQDASPGYAMPTELAAASSMPDRAPTSGRQITFTRIADMGRDAALKGPNPEEHMLGTWHRATPFRPIGNFDRKPRPLHTIYRATGNFEELAG